MKNGSVNTGFVVSTSGLGLWSKRDTNVHIIKIAWDTPEPENDEVRETFVEVYFDPKTWNCKRDGLLYTDAAFESGLRTKILELVAEGKLPAELAWKDISFTEQGMQASRYVHMILGTW